MKVVAPETHFCAECGREFELWSELQIKAWAERKNLCPTCHHKEESKSI
jgi:DNA-directed RNA polymerase subunit RPC12/RpoP